MSAKVANPTFFKTPAAFRRWLRKHGDTATELLVGFWKVDSGEASMTWPESVDEALSFGWIDGIRRRIDDRAYSIRFAPRRPGSTWSAVNIARVPELEREGRMTPAGRAAFARRIAEKSRVYAYEQAEHATLEASEQKRFERNTVAWAFFAAQPPGYRRTLLYWVASAKKADTRAARLDKLIAASGAHTRMR